MGINIEKGFWRCKFSLISSVFYCSILRRFKLALKPDGNWLSQTVRICSRKFLLLLYIRVADICYLVCTVLWIASSRWRTGSAVDQYFLWGTMQKETNSQFPATVLVFSLLHVVQIAITFPFTLVAGYVHVHMSELLWNFCQCGFWPHLRAVSGIKLSWYEWMYGQMYSCKIGAGETCSAVGCQDADETLFLSPQPFPIQVEIQPRQSRYHDYPSNL